MTTNSGVGCGQKMSAREGRERIPQRSSSQYRDPSMKERGRVQKWQNVKLKLISWLLDWYGMSYYPTKSMEANAVCKVCTAWRSVLRQDEAGIEVPLLMFAVRSVNL